MAEKIKKINKSFKYEGYLFVTTDDKEVKRRYRENIKGRFAGKITFNVWDNVYSFIKPSNWMTDDKCEVLGSDIKYEGKYTELYNVKDRTTKKETTKKETTNENDWVETQEAVEQPEQEEKWEDKGPVKHAKYEVLRACIQNNVPIYLVGPAGSGKNFTLEQIADELGMNFYFSNSVQQEYKLTGFIDAGGDYHETEFYKACKDAVDGKDVVFFLDEMDASIPEVLVLLNAAIANGYFEFPNGKLKFGNKVHFVAAGNTFGNGADEQYTGRLTLDQATLDRFAVVEFGYDLNIEMSLAKGNAELVSFIEEMRTKAEQTGVRATFSYRCITMVAQLEAVLKLEDVLKMAVFKGFDKDTINTLRTYGSTKYHKAMDRLVA